MSALGPISIEPPRDGNDATALVQAGLIGSIERHLDLRWSAYLRDASVEAAGEVLAGLLARQTDLALAFARSSVLWEPAVAPVLLRTMIETHINLAWIAKDSAHRARLFVEYGLGQMKLINEHRKAYVDEQGGDLEDDDPYVAQKAWLEAQRMASLTEVNVGSWSGKSTRQLAIEAGLISLYNLAYEPFSGAVHSQWHCVGWLNMDYCADPLHGLHRLPVWGGVPERHHLLVAVKYLTLSLEECDAWAGVHPTKMYPLGWLNDAFEHAAQASGDGSLD